LASRNLDSWLLAPFSVVELFHRAMAGKDVAIVEGVMGLYDGFRGDDEEGSTAQIAKLLGLPVILVVDAAAAARSVGATVLGFKKFDPAVDIAGVVLNGIAGERHLEFVRPSLVRAGVPVLGYLPKDAAIALPERHLGLVPTGERTLPTSFYDGLAQQVQRTIDIDRILSVATPLATVEDYASSVFPREPLRPKVAIAFAMDKAFNFYYADSLELLRAWGAELVPFSPLEDRELPPAIGGIYIGGGFPELYARELSENKTTLLSLRKLAVRGLPLYAECGGLMYLGASVEGSDGKNYPMVELFPYRSTIKETRLTIGYRHIEAIDNNPLMQQGESTRGHEFHLSQVAGPSPHPTAYRVLDQTGRCEGFRIHNVLASYIHVHLGSNKNLAPHFVNFCSSWMEQEFC
jgi:cobyrinic acid a,c-diamide synthase